MTPTGNYARLTPEKRRRFLRALARGYAVSYAAEHAGVSRRQTLYELRARSTRFAAAWDRAYWRGEEALKAAEEAESARIVAWLAERRAERLRQRDQRFVGDG